MMNWFYYLLEANLYLSVFYGCYRLLLRNETFYAANRFFLILSTIMAFSLPLLQLGYLNQLLENRIDQQITGVLVENNPNESDFSVLNSALYLLYIAVVIAFSGKLLADLYQIVSLSRKSERYKKNKITYISLKQHNVAFSFFNMLFIQPDIQGKEMILKHELVHIRQRHSLDIIFFEIIQILNWFNPITYLLKKDIKLLHEYIADEQTTQKEIGKYDYALFLIKNSLGMESNPLSNHIFNQSILKQRINMLNKEKSTGRARLKLLLVLPMAAAMLGTSTMAFTKDYGLVDLYPENLTHDLDEVKTPKPVYLSEIQEPVKIKSQKPVKKTKAPAAPKAPNVPPPAPPAEPRKVSQIKFPPPIVTKDKAAKKNKNKKVDKIKFPPPIVRKDATQDEKFPTPIVVDKVKPIEKPRPAVAVEELSSSTRPATYPIESIKSTKEGNKNAKPEHQNPL